MELLENLHKILHLKFLDEYIQEIGQSIFKLSCFFCIQTLFISTSDRTQSENRQWHWTTKLWIQNISKTNSEMALAVCVQPLKAEFCSRLEFSTLSLSLVIDDLHANYKGSLLLQIS